MASCGHRFVWTEWRTVYPGSGLFLPLSWSAQALINYFQHCHRMLKAVFAWHGIPEILQWATVCFKGILRVCHLRVQHITSSPRFPQSNGQVEGMVQTLKGTLKQSTDPRLNVLSYRATPMPWCGWSPSELLMGWQIRSTVPHTKRQLIPNWSYHSDFKRANLQFNPFPDVAGYIRHGHMHIFKKIYKKKWKLSWACPEGCWTRGKF